MDERHLWIAAYIKSSFDSSDFQNQSAIEEYMLQEEILDKVNYFLSGNGSPQLFFYHESIGSTLISNLKELKCSLALDSENFKKNGSEKAEISLLYFFRPTILTDVPLAQFEKEVIVGHMKGKVLDNFLNVFKRVILPLMKCRRDWGHCPEENKNSLLSTVERSIEFAKSVASISEDIPAENLLAVPPELLVESVNVQTDANFINLLDSTVSGWIGTIENLITGFAQESSVSLTEGPLSELDRWRHRQKMLNSLTEQLKSKACKTVLTLLVASKSKVLKKWRIVDSQITDALNESKDRLKFMTSMSRQFEEFYASGASPQSIGDSTLPNLMNALVQADSVSRFHARSGFLGLLMTKLTNQLVSVCKAYISELTVHGDKDTFWNVLEDDLGNLSIEYITDLLSRSNESRFKARKRIGGDAVESPSNTLCNRLHSCVQLYFTYRAQLSRMRDSINLTPSHPGSQGGSVMGSKVTSKRASATAEGLHTHQRSSGSVSLTDDETIFGHFDEFCRRIHTLLDLSLSLKQLSSFSVSSSDLPRISASVLNSLESPISTTDVTTSTETPLQTEPSTMMSARKLTAISEKEEDIVAKPKREPELTRTPSLLETIDNSAESRENTNFESEEEDDDRKFVISPEELVALRRFLGHNDPELVTIAYVVKNLYADVLQTFTTNLSSAILLDVETENKELFTKNFLEFSVRISEFEKFLCAYLNVVFLRRQPVFKAVQVLKKFDPLDGREAVREVLQEKYVDTFIWFQPELRQIQDIYEEGKSAPPVSRDAPPIGGIVEWCRMLLQRIEEPMRIFRSQSAINSLRDFGRVSRVYNALAAPLVAYEAMCLQRWRREVNGITESFRLTLLYQDPETGQLVVNADPRIREHIAESHYLQRLGIELPKPAIQLLSFELTFKRCYSKLSHAIRQFASSFDRLLPRFRPIFAAHHRRVMTVLHPGLSTLAWNSVNIEAYLHSAETATSNFRAIVDGFLDDLDSQVHSKIKELKNCVLLDFSCFNDASVLNLADFRANATMAVKGRSQNAALRLLEIQESVRRLVTQVYSGDKAAPNTGNADNANRRIVNEADRELENIIGIVMTELMPSINEAIETMLRKSLAQLELIISFTPFITVDVELPSAAQKSSINMNKIESLGDFASHVETVNWKQLLQACLPGPLAIRIVVDYTLPKIRIDPSPAEIFETCKSLATQMCSFERDFNISIAANDILNDFMDMQHVKFNNAKVIFDSVLRSCAHYDWIWQDASANVLNEAVASTSLNVLDMSLEAIHRLEDAISTIPMSISHASFQLAMEPIVHALDAAARQWKFKFSNKLHDRARAHLDKMWQYMDSVALRLDSPTDRLEDLSAIIALFDETADVQLNSDALFTEIETLYRRIERSDVAVPREETDKVESLRYRWADLVHRLDALRVSLLRDRRSAFEQELDKQTKAFVLEVIQFRNRFDAHGPGVSGIAPAEAARRLNEFKMHFAEYDQKRQVLHTVARLFGIPARPFTELTRLEEELNLLTQLYSVYQEFIDFDEKFRQTLWADLNHVSASSQVASYWNKVINLPERLQKWEACSHLKESINFYRDVLPLIEKLAARHIRSRHWLQVMSVTGQQFSIEANTLKMASLLKLPLLKYMSGIEEICFNASKEMELEMNLRKIQEEWTEQQLAFAPYGQRGPLLLASQFTGRLVEQLEDAQTTLATMLTSRHVAPLRSEVAGWAERLRDVAQILDLWLQVQDRWQELEVVFSKPETAKELPQIAEKFFSTEKTWVKLMIKAHETRNVIQCCITGDSGSRLSLLLQLRQDLEQCCANLQSYIDSKRLMFPRFALLSNAALLAALSRPYSLDSLRPVLKSLFANIGDIRLIVNEVRTADRQRQHTSSTASLEESAFRLRSSVTPGNVPEKGASSVPAERLRALPSEKLFEEIRVLEATDLISWDGEELKLVDHVVLDGVMENWLAKLCQSTKRSLDAQFMALVKDMTNGVSPDEWVLKYCTQCCSTGLLLAWTIECDLGIAELKAERRALTASSKKFAMYSGRLVQLSVTGRIQGREMAPINYIQRARLDTLISYSLYLRDIVEGMANQKMRDPIEFDWRKCIKCYPVREGDGIRPLLAVLDAGHPYGGEFYGSRPIIAIGPDTERCFISLSEGIHRLRGAALVGPSGSGKTETIQGFAQLCGRFLPLIGCLRELSPSAIGRIVQGMAMSGDWCCMDDVELLVESSALLLSGFCQAIMTALRAGNPHCVVASGEQISLNPDARLFISFTTQKTHIGASSVPSSLLSTFRPVAISLPSPHYLLRIRACELGFRSWQCLSARLTAVMELSTSYLRENVAKTVNLSAMLRVLERAALRRRMTRAYDAAVLIAAANDQPPPRKSIEQEQFELEQPGDDSGGASGFESTTPRAQSRASPDKVNKQRRKVVRRHGNIPPLSNSVKADHALVGHYVRQLIGSRIPSDQAPLFNQIVNDIFSGLPLIRRYQTLIDVQGEKKPLDGMLVEAAKKLNLSTQSNAWLEKVSQLYETARVSPGIILAGPSGVGKSSALRTLVDALASIAIPGSINQAQLGESAPETLAGLGHRIQKIYPMVCDNVATIFGELRPDGTWRDGVFTAVMKKANRNESVTWLCLDGPLDPLWTEYFAGLLDKRKTFTFGNGDQLFLGPRVRVIFETDVITMASPATVSRMGVIYFDMDQSSWRPSATMWLSSQTEMVRRVLEPAFERAFDYVFQFMQDNKPAITCINELGLLTGCLSLMGSLIADNQSLTQETHLERLFIFSIISTFGSVLAETDHKAFGDGLKAITNVLPDDDREISVFDYYVDETGEWDTWVTKIPENQVIDSPMAVVDTVDTIRARLILNCCWAAGRNVLILGGTASAKTMLINEFLIKADPKKTVTKAAVGSCSTSADSLQALVEANVVHRQGYVYGAKDRKRLAIFVDDLNLPGKQPLELLRQVADDGFLVTTKAPYEWHQIENILLMGAATLPATMIPGRGLSLGAINHRLTRHYTLVHLNPPQGEELKSVLSAVLNQTMHSGQGQLLEVELHNAIVAAGSHVLTEVLQVLKPAPCPGRTHYLFSVRDLVTSLQSLRRLDDDHRQDVLTVVSYWRHEMMRTFADRVCRASDGYWLRSVFENTIADKWPELSSKLANFFVTIPEFVTMKTHQKTQLNVKENKSDVTIVDSIASIRDNVTEYLTHYMEDVANRDFDVALTDAVLEQIVRMHRLLTKPDSCRLLLLAQHGFKIIELCRLSLHIAETQLCDIDTTNADTFLADLRSLIRVAGLEPSSRAIILKTSELRDAKMWDLLNSILVSSFHHQLLSNDELEALLQTMIPQIRSRRNNASVSLLNNNPFQLFLRFVSEGLRIIIVVTPDDILLKNAMTTYPGLLKSCSVNWIVDWAPEALVDHVSYYLSDKTTPVFTDISSKTELSSTGKDLRKRIAECMANIHIYMIEFFAQLPWVGDASQEVAVPMDTYNSTGSSNLKKQVGGGRADTSTPQQGPSTGGAILPNFPYSKFLLSDCFKSFYRGPVLGKPGQVFICSKTFQNFIDLFISLYRRKSQEIGANLELYSNGVEVLDKSSTDCAGIRTLIKDKRREYAEVTEKANQMLQTLIAKVTQLEKLKTERGLNPQLRSILEQVEADVSFTPQDDPLLRDDLDDFDREFDKIQEEKNQQRLAELATLRQLAEADVEANRNNLQHAKDQVMLWRSRVERTTIERLRSFQKPSKTIIEVMEMVMTLIGKRQPVITKGDGAVGVDGASQAGQSQTTQSRPAARISAAPPSDASRWKAMQIFLSDSGKFVEQVIGIPWEDGLKPQLRIALEQYFSKSDSGELGLTGEGSLLENAAETNIAAKRATVAKTSTTAGQGITISAAKFASEDAAILVQYVIAVVEYSRRCAPLQAAIDKLKAIDREVEDITRMAEQRRKEAAQLAEVLEENVMESSMSDRRESKVVDDLEYLERETANLQKQYDDLIELKHSLSREVDALRQQLTDISTVVRRLEPVRATWASFIQSNNDEMGLLVNCLTAAAFLVYGAPADIETRSRIIQYLSTITDHHSLAIKIPRVLKDVPLLVFLQPQIGIEQLRLLRFPTTPELLDNLCLLAESDQLTTTWPLLCDPTRFVENWLQSYLEACRPGEVVVVRHEELKGQLEYSLAEGYVLLILDCDLKRLFNDRRLVDVIKSKWLFFRKQKSNTLKFTVNKQEVEAKMGFRLVLHTTNQPHIVPYEMFAQLAVAYFPFNRASIEEELLGHFMRKEKARTESDYLNIITQDKRNNDLRKSIEVTVANDLKTCSSLSVSPAVTKHCLELCNRYEETVEIERTLKVSAGELEAVRQTFVRVAQLASVCCDLMQRLIVLSPLYHISFTQFLAVFHQSIEHSERSEIGGTTPKTIQDRLIFNCYAYVSRMVSDMDRIIFVMALALELEEMGGRVKPNERRYLISPTFASQFADLHLRDANVQKSPFDWMSDDQWYSMNVLAALCPQFTDVPRMISSDGTENQWRHLTESDVPELLPLPQTCNINTNLSALQTLLVYRAIRSDRILPATIHFIRTVLGKRFITEPAIDLSDILTQSMDDRLILLFYKTEPDAVYNTYMSWTQTLDVPCVVLPTSQLTHSSNFEQFLEANVNAAAAKNGWLLVREIGRNPNLFGHLLGCIRKLDPMPPNFRCVLSMDASNLDNVPIEVLHHTLRVYVDTPRLVRSSMVHSLITMHPDQLRQSPRPEWPILVHNLCFLHAAVRLRTRYGTYGWSRPEQLSVVSQSDLVDAMTLVVNCLMDGHDKPSSNVANVVLPRAATITSSGNTVAFAVAPAAAGVADKRTSIDSDGAGNTTTVAPTNTALAGPPRGMQLPWVNIRHAVTEIYGKYLTEENDRATLAALVDVWLSLNSIKREFEMTKLKYKPPAILFQSGPLKPQQIASAFDNLAEFQMEVPDAAGFHAVKENYLGDDQYVITRINKLYDVLSGDAIAAAAKLEGQESQATYTETSLAAVSVNALMPHVLAKGVNASASMLLTRPAPLDVELADVCSSILSKLPRTYSRGYLVEKLKKIGGLTSFNTLLLSEMEILYGLVNGVRQDLTQIRSALTLATFGWQLEEDLIKVAASLYHSRIPSSWLRLAGDAIPDETYPLATWIADLAHRVSILERLFLLGREKTPAYWLGAFTRPQALLALMKQDAFRYYGVLRAGAVDSLIFHTELTARDKDHLRDPPQEGMFVFGLHLWSCGWDKSVNELLDTTTRRYPAELPVIHVTCIPASERPTLELAKSLEQYSCPVYATRSRAGSPLFEVLLHRDGIQATRWHLRGVFATVRPY